MTLPEKKEAHRGGVHQRAVSSLYQIAPINPRTAALENILNLFAAPRCPECGSLVEENYLCPRCLREVWPVTLLDDSGRLARALLGLVAEGKAARNG